MKRARKLISLILAACILLPAQAYAYVGRLEELMQNVVNVTAGNLDTSDGSHFQSLKTADGKLVFYLATDGPHIGKSVTMSERGYVDPAESIEKGVYEQARFTIQTGKTQRALTVKEIAVVDAAELERENVGFGMSLENSLTVRYRFDGYSSISPEVDCYINYSIVQLGAGIQDGEITGDMDMPLYENPDDNRTYAVLAIGIWKTANDNVQRYVFRWFQDYHGFSRMGHSGALEGSAHVKMSRTYSSQQLDSANSTDITTGLGRTNLDKRYGNGSVSEIYSDSYGVDSPFVLAEVDRISYHSDIWPPVYMTYDSVSDCLTAEGYTAILGSQSGTGGIDSMRALHAWGLRNIYTKDEAAAAADVKFTEPDAVNIPQDADKLGFYKSGSDIVVEPITDSARENVLKKKYGNPLYTLRGEFEFKSDENGAYYEFTDYKVALTSTITAVWMGDNNYFRVRVDDSKRFINFDTTNFVNYSTPRFRLYSPRNGNAETPQLTFEDADDEICLALNMKPEDNDVLVFIDIPEVSSKINKAQIKPDGDLVLSGMMGLDLILNCSPDRLATLDALGYGPKENDDGTISFVQNGIKAHGGLDTGSLLGLDLAEIETEINTFGGEEEYAFSLELNAFELFETAAELNLKRLYNGRLCPDTLYFELQAEPGIPLIPPVPTSYLKGGGGGFSGLADTINGDYIAIPPIRLKLTAIGDYVKIIEGKVHLTLGPSYLEYAGSDMTIAKADVLDSFNMYLKLAGEKRKYKNKTYTGLRAGGGMGIGLKAPQGDAAIFEVDGNAEATMFGGLDSYKKPTAAYIQLDSRGSIGAKVKIPKKLGKIEFKKLSGKELASTTVDFILGAQTAVTVDPKSYEGQSAGKILETAAESAWNNLSVYGGVSNKGTLLLINYRIYYIIPDKFGGAVDVFWNDMNDWTLEDEIGESAWNISKKSRAYKLAAEPGWQTQLGQCYDAETNEQIGIAVIENSLYELPANDADNAPVLLTSNGTYTKDIHFTASDNTKVSDSELGFTLVPSGSATVEDLKRNLKIVSDGTELTLKYADIINGELVPDANIAEIELEDGKSGLLVAPGGNGDQNHTWNVTADCDFEYKLVASAQPTALELEFDGINAESTVQNPRTGKEYAVRYYFDTAKDRSGQNYFIDMETLSGSQTVSDFTIPGSGTLAPSGEYYVTAVLTEKIKGDFDGDGTVGENEYSWVTVDTKTADNAISFTNTDEPVAPAGAELQFTGNETLTASWDKAENADGYRVTLFYLDGTEWKQAGGSYVLDNADFSDSKIKAASAENGKFSLRMAPTVGGEEADWKKDPQNSAVSTSSTSSSTGSAGGAGGSTIRKDDAAPANANYKVAVEAFRNEQTESDAPAVSNLRYFSKPTESGTAYLSEYAVPEIIVNYNGNDEIILNGTNGYDAIIWGSIPSGTLFTLTGSSSISNIEITHESASGSFDVTGGNGTWEVTADDDAKNIIENSGRIKISVSEDKNVTDYYLRLALDDVAPLLTLDSENVYADVETGAFDVTGTTEPGLTVSMVTDDNGSVLTAKADVHGRFTISGTLTQDTLTVFDENGDETSQQSGFQSILSEVTTQDESGNASEPVPVLISAREKSQSEISDSLSISASPATLIGGGTVTLTVANAGENVNVTCSDNTVTVTGSGSAWSAVLPNNNADYTFTATDGSETASCTVTVTYYKGGSGRARYYTVSFETNGGTKTDSIKVVSNGTISKPADPAKDGYTFGGWFSDKKLTAAYDFGTKVTKNMILYAKWTEEKEDPDTQQWDNPYADVKSGDWFYENVKYAAQNKLFSGTTATTFEPNMPITRGMFVTVLYRAEGEPEVGKNMHFADVASDSYYADAVIWAEQNGIVTGTSETAFSPNDNITREQLAAIVYRYAKHKKYDTSAGEDTNILSYDDAESISEYAVNAMQYAVGAGLIKGKSESTLNPKDSTTRAEAAAILQRFIESNK